MGILDVYSAGVGRTGTFIAIDIEIQRIKHERLVDVYNSVCRLRNYRAETTNLGKWSD